MCALLPAFRTRAMVVARARDCYERVSAWAHACASVTDVSVVVRQACEDVLSTPVGTLAVYLERQASAQRVPPLELIRAITARMGEGNQIVRACPEVFCCLARLLSEAERVPDGYHRWRKEGFHLYFQW